MKKTLLIMILFSVSIWAQEIDKKKRQSVKKPRSVVKFFDIKVDNPELQAEVDLLKQEYLNELTTIKEKFKNKKKKLKMTYKSRLKELGVERKKTTKGKDHKKS